MIHLLAWAVGLSVFRFGLVAPQTCPEIDVSDLDAAVAATAGWAEVNLRQDGRFLYRYDRTSGEVLDGYNVTRHAAMTNALYQVAAEGDPRWLEAADDSLQYMLDNLVDTSPQSHAPGEESSAFAVGGANPRIGASALLLTALAHRRDATGDASHDDLMRRLARFLVGQIEPNGAIAVEWDPTSREPVVGEYGIFATGEASWALAMIDDIFVGEGWADHAIDIVEYVIHERRSHEALLLRAPDHWIAYTVAELGDRWVPEPDEVEYLERLAGDFAIMIRVESQRSGQGIQRLIRFDQALGAGVGALGEGLAGLQRTPALAHMSDDLGEHLVCTAATLVNRQVGPDDVVTDAGREVGAWFTDDVTQVDDQQHTLSTLLFARRVLSEETP